MQPVYDFLRPYWPTLLFFVVFPVLAAAANWLLWWDTPERWDAFVAKHPERARWIRILRAIAPHLRKLLTVARDGAASKGAPQAVRLLSPPVALLADKAAAVAVSETRGFDASARQAIAPDVVAVAQRITRESERGFATVRALLAAVVLMAVVGVVATGCPLTREASLIAARAPSPTDCRPGAQRCMTTPDGYVPVVCSHVVALDGRHREWPSLPRDPADGRQRTCLHGCVVDDRGAHCVGLGGAR